MTTWMWVLAITLLALVVLGVVITVAISLNTKPSSGGKNNFLSTVREKSTVYAVMVFKSFVAVVLIHVIIYLISDKWWTDHILNIEVAILQVVMVIAFWVIPASIFKTERVLAYFMAGLLGVAFVWVVFFKDHAGGNNDPRSALEKLRSQVSKPSPTSPTSGQNVYARSTDNGGNFFIPVGTPACFKEALGPDKDAAYAAFPGQMDLMAVFCRESRFYHRGSDGKPRTNINENGTVDTGIAQINSTHDAELARLHLDKNQLEDNLKYAGILYEKNGLTDWNPKVGQQLVFEVEAGNEWSNTFKTPQLDPAKRPFNFGIKYDGPITVALNDESEIVESSNGRNLGYPRNYKFKSAVAGKKVLVTVTYQY